MKAYTTTTAKRAAVLKASRALKQAEAAKEAAAEAYREAEREARAGRLTEAEREAAALEVLKAEEAEREAAKAYAEAERTPTIEEAEAAALAARIEAAKAAAKEEAESERRKAIDRAFAIMEAAAKEEAAEREAAAKEAAESRARRYISAEELKAKNAAEAAKEAKRAEAARAAKLPEAVSMKARIEAYNEAYTKDEDEAAKAAALELLARAVVASDLRKIRRLTPESKVINGLYNGLYRNASESRELPEAAALVNEAAAALLEYTARHTPNGAPVNIERSFTVRRLKYRVAIKEEDAPEVFEEVSTTIIQEAFRAVRRAIEAARSVQAPEAALHFNYIKTEAGGYRRISNHREGITAEELKDEAAIIEELKLTAREALILKYRLEAFGYNAIARRLGITPRSVRKALERIGERAARRFDIAAKLTGEAKQGEARRKLSPADRCEVYAAILSGESFRAVADRFGISKALVQKTVEAFRAEAAAKEEAEA